MRIIIGKVRAHIAFAQRAQDRICERVCQRVVFLSRGKVVADGSPTEVALSFGRPSLEDVFMHLATQEEL